MCGGNGQVGGAYTWAAKLHNGGLQMAKHCLEEMAGSAVEFRMSQHQNMELMYIAPEPLVVALYALVPKQFQASTKGAQECSEWVRRCVPPSCWARWSLGQPASGNKAQ